MAQTYLERARDSHRGRLNSLRDRTALALRQTGGGSLPHPYLGRHSSIASLAARFDDTAKQEEQYKHFVSWVYVAITRIATRAAGQPMRAGRVNVSPQKARRLSTQQKSHAPGYVKAVADDIEPIPTHALLDAISNPNHAMVTWSLMYALLSGLELTGVAYWWMPRTSSGLQIWPLPSSWVTPVHAKGRLFDSFEVRSTSSMGKPVPVEHQDMAMFLLPDPEDPTRPKSPVQAQAPAVSTDEQIQVAQHRFFQNGIFPQVILHAGRLPDAMGVPGERPSVTPEQRVELMNAIAAVYDGVVNYNEPLILDGLIENVSKFSQTAQEMDFLQSSEQVKGRIFQAFGVNPIIAGEIAGVNRAQAAVAETLFTTNVVNPLLTMVGQVLTQWARKHEEGTVIWLDMARANDEELNLREWDKAMVHRVATKNEFRVHILGLPEIDREDFNEPPEPQSQVAQGQSVQEESALPSIRGAKNTAEPSVSRKWDKFVGGLWEKNAAKSERRLQEAMHGLFREQAKTATSELLEIAKRSPGLFVEGNAAELARQAFNPRDWDAPLTMAAAQPMVLAMATGYVTERAILKSRTRNGRLTSLKRLRQPDPVFDRLVEEIQANLPRFIAEDVPEAVMANIVSEVAAIIQEPWWKEINDTQLRYLESSLRTGIDGGWSVSKIAKDIERFMGDGSRSRSMLIARTETPGLLNGGHVLQMKELEETGLTVVKEWLTVGDADVRDQHIAMQGERTQPADAVFTLPNGETTPHPAHYSLSPANRCNCRCTVMSDVDLDQLDELEAAEDSALAAADRTP